MGSGELSTMFKVGEDICMPISAVYQKEADFNLRQKEQSLINIGVALRSSVENWRCNMP